MSRALFVATGILAVAGLVGAVYLVGRSDGADRRSGGPLACPRCAGDAGSASVRVGKAATIGSIYLTNRGTEPAVLEGVQLLNADSGIELAGARIVVPSGSPLVGFMRAYPPANPGGPTRRVRGYTLAPASGDEGTVQLLLGVKATAEGNHVYGQVAVDYRVNDHRYRAVFKSSVRLCAPLDLKANCPVPPI